MPLHEPNHWTCIQHQHFCLLTCQPISSHTCYAEITELHGAFSDWRPLTFSFTLPELCFHFRVAQQKSYQTFPDNLLYLILPLSLCPSPLFFLSICLLFKVLSFTLPTPLFTPPPPPLWWDPDVQLLWRTSAPPQSPCRPGLDPSRPYKVELWACS